MSFTIQSNTTSVACYFSHSAEEGRGTREPGASAVSWHTYCEVHFLEGQVEVLKSHSHHVLSVIQVTEVRHDDFCTLLPTHREELCL